MNTTNEKGSKMYQNESENLKPAKFKFRKRIITIAAIALCGLVAGITALVTANDSSNTTHAAGYMNVTAAIDSGQGVIYISKIERQRSETDTTWITENFTQAQAKTSAYIYNNHNANGFNNVKVTFKAVASSGYDIGYWFINNDAGGKNHGNDTYTIEFCCNSDTDTVRNIKVRFIEAGGPYTVTVLAGANGYIPTEYKSIVGTKMSDGRSYAIVKAEPNSGWYIKEWVIVSGGGNAYLNERYAEEKTMTIYFSADVTIRADFTNITHTLTVNTYPMGIGCTATVTPNKTKHGHNTIVNIEYSAAEGYELLNWTWEYLDSNTNKTNVCVNGYPYRIQENTKVTLNFTPITYFAKVSMSGVSTSDTSSVGYFTSSSTKSAYTHGESVKFTLNLRDTSKYKFTGWSASGYSNLGTSLTVELKVVRDTNLYAVFLPIRSLEVDTSTTTYDIPIPSGGGGTVHQSLPGNSFERGTLITFTAYPIENFYISSWTLTREGYLTATYPADGNTYELTIMVNTIVTANFAQKQPYPIKLNIHTYDNNTQMSTVGGTVTQSPTGGTIMYGDEVTFTATAYEGFAIRSWTVVANGVTTTYDKLESITFVMSGDTVVTANFNKMYKLEAG